MFSCSVHRASAFAGILLPLMLGCGSSLVDTSSDGAPGANVGLPDDERSAEKGLPFTVAYETTRVTEPLRDDGAPDYVHALDADISREATHQNNFVVVLWREFGARYMKEQRRSDYFAKLGIEPPPRDGDYLKNFLGLDHQQQLAPERYAELEERYFERDWESKPWRKTDFPELAQWLADYDAAISRLAAGAERTKLYSPLVARGDGSLALAGEIDATSGFPRDAARILAMRAMLRLGEGDVAGAWADQLACHRIAQLTGQGPFSIEALVCFATHSTLARCVRHRPSRGRPSRSGGAVPP